ncbi:NAD(P)-dependent oxidoreductase [Leptospira sp. 201903075]|uniref:NAD-dependent epimerase/dehydratase family protein n=1 Tax=Leptospira chreensis TaxID=2810035 RepID=UPI001965EB2D|nr:NAD(P)-dependent oxidoreductase [Leptospira chreensis]MBM9589050.1 NAD(P)-dependent oxidoreductase [Leptospira chreensis]
MDFTPFFGESLLITGGTGFIGRWLLETFLYAKLNHGLDLSISILTRDENRFLNTYPKYKNSYDLQHFSLLVGDIQSELDKTKKYTYIIHAATESDSRNRESIAKKTFDTIVLGTKNVLEYAAEIGTKNFLFLSSGAVYGNSATDNIDEEFNGAPRIESKNTYGESKRAAELLCQIYGENSFIHVSIVRCFAFVGPGLPLDSNYAIGNFIKNVLDGESIHIKGDGTPVRSYMYPTDLVVWLLHSLLKTKKTDIFNIGSDLPISIRDLAELVLELSGEKTSIQVDSNPLPNQRINWYVPSTAKIKSMLTLDIKYSLRESIQKTLSYYKENR